MASHQRVHSGVYVLNYENTFARVPRMTTIRTLFVVASIRKWDIYQMDVKNAFLNGVLREEFYMYPSPGLLH